MPAKTESCFEGVFEGSLEFVSSCFMLLFSVFTTFYETNPSYYISQVSNDVFLTEQKFKQMLKVVHIPAQRSSLLAEMFMMLIV